MTPERQTELIAINKVLAALVVFLSLSSGYLLATTKSWLKTTPSLETTNSYPSTHIDSEQVVSLQNPPPHNANQLISSLYQNHPKRNYQSIPLSHDQLSNILWSTSGITTSWGDRTFLSYKSIYPINTWVYIKHQDSSIPPGLYLYQPQDNSLLLSPQTVDLQTINQAFDQPSLTSAPLIVIFTADLNTYQETTGTSSTPFLYQEVGAMAQNLHLSARSQNLGSSFFYNYQDQNLSQYFPLPSDETILAVVTLGIPVYE